jgi:UDP-glucose 4-epimerase
VANSERAKTLLGWKPEFADLDVIVEHAWGWEKKLAVAKG